MVTGVTVALATPVTEDGTLDEKGLARLLERVLSAGVDGVSPAGSTGEGARLTPRQRVQLTATVRAAVGPDVPVVSGTPLTTVHDGLAEIEEVAAAGATAVLVAPPHYYPLGDDEVLRVYEPLAERSVLPIVLYNIPVFTKISISPDVVGRLATHRQIVGIKDSSRDMEYLQQVLIATHGADFTVLTGSDTQLVASLAAGAAGTIAASVNLVPELAVGIVAAFRAGRTEEAWELQRRLIQIVMAARVGRAPAGWKHSLEYAGVCSGRMVPPGIPLPEAARVWLADRLAELGVAAG